MTELQALALSLATKYTFHKGKISHHTGTLTTTDLANWVSDNAEPREIHLLSIRLPDLADITDLLDLSNTWDTNTLVDRNLLLAAGPWKQANKTITWESFLEREGLPTHACCPNPD